jgi:hypothetical protein
VLRAYVDGLLLFSNQEHGGARKCQEMVVDRLGTAGDRRGVVFAPKALIIADGSNLHTMEGRLIGWGVNGP